MFWQRGHDFCVDCPHYLTYSRCMGLDSQNNLLYEGTSQTTTCNEVAFDSDSTTCRCVTSASSSKTLPNDDSASSRRRFSRTRRVLHPVADSPPSAPAGSASARGAIVRKQTSSYLRSAHSYPHHHDPAFSTRRCTRLSGY